MTNDDQVTKKCKSNPCISCLGLLQDHIIDDVVNRVVDSNVLEYDSEVFTCSVSLPACILIREYSIQLDVKKTFPEFYSEGKYNQNDQSLKLYRS